MSAEQTAIRSRSCKCPGAEPVTCVGDEEIVTQWVVRPDEFSIVPRERDSDLALSLVRGSLDATEAYMAVTGDLPSKTRQAELAARWATAGEIRRAGFALVHTPGRQRKSPHLSVVLPADEPLDVQDASWPEEASIGFDKCFSEERG